MRVPTEITEPGFGAPLPSAPDLSDASVADPYGKVGISRLPTGAYSGKKVLTDALAHGLGYEPDAEISADVAADRVRRYLNVTKGIRDEDPIAPQDALMLARTKLEEAKAQLYGTVQGGPPAAQFDQAGFDSLLDRRFAPPIQPGTATFQDVPAGNQALAIGYALARLFRGESLGQAAGYMNAPVAMAQQSMDRDHAFAVQGQNIDRDRAGVEMQQFLAQSQDARKQAYDQWGLDIEVQKDAVGAADELVRRLEIDTQRAMNAQEKMLLEQVTKGKYMEDRVGALNQLRSRGKITEMEYAAMYPTAATKRVSEEREEAIAQDRLAGAQLKRTRAEHIPKEHQLKVQNLDRLIKRDEENAKIARERLQVAMDANEIRLQIADQRDATKRYEIGLRAPLWSAQIGEAMARARSTNFRDMNEVWKAYQAQIKEQQAEVGRLRDDIRDGIRKMKDLKGGPREALEELVSEMQQRLASEERRMVELEQEFESIRPKAQVEGPTGKVNLGNVPTNPLSGAILPNVGGKQIELPPERRKQ